MAVLMKPNGNIDYATSMEDGEYAQLMDRQKWRKHPRAFPLVSPRTEMHPDIPVDACNHDGCCSTDQHGYSILGREKVRHGSFCNGSRPRWESRLVIRLLSPGLLMKDLTEKCRSVVLASGSLAPLPSLCAELNLHGPKEDSSSQQTNSPLRYQASQTSQSQTPVKSEKKRSVLNDETSQVPSGRLQVKPKPLEANHVSECFIQISEAL